MRICVVEDNDVFREMLRSALVSHGFEVSAAIDAQDLDRLLKGSVFDAYILELNLPGEDGLSIAARLKRAYPNAFIVMATARERVEDRIVGYETGADIYMTKPLHVRELVAALESVERRHVGAQLTVARLVLDVRGAVLRGDDSVPPVRLTPTELRLLKGLVEAPDCLLEHWQLLDLLEKEADDASKRVLEVHVVNLRKKLQLLGAEQPAIGAVRGVGYRLLVPLVVR
jgi:two-component system phosphate regulon response regulator OmpR